MGCDIHIFVERRTNGKWDCIDDMITEDDDYQYVNKQIYDGRNYSLFALLADVRNDSGIKPISEPKGLPSDVSDIVKKISDRWNGDGHSHSYFTLEDLLSFNKNILVKESGYMPNERWILFQESLKSSSPDYNLRYPHSGWANPDLLPSWSYHIWEIPAKEIDNIFFTKTLDTLKEKGKPEDIRIVFWFDN